jgi:hypothetical protein
METAVRMHQTVEAVLGVQEDAVRVPEQLLVQVREPQHEEQEQEQVRREPRHHHNLWRRWRGSKKSFSSTRQMSFSKPHRWRCANC